MSTAVKPARKSSVLTEAVMRQAEQAREEKKTEAVTADQKFPKIKENTFFQVVFAEGKPEEKRSAIAKARTFSGTKEEMRQREKAYEEFKEYLAYQRELMSSQIISLQDNETFGLLQTVYGGFTDRLRDFDKKIEPLTRVLTSLFNLRTNGVSFDAIDQIERDREHERGIQAKIEANVERLKDIESQLRRLDDDIAYLRTQKSLFGFGDIKAEAKGQIARHEREIERLRGDAKAVAEDNAKLEAEREAARNANEKLAPFASELADLRELLDLSSDEHKKRQEELMKAALDFISTSVTSVDQVRNHMGKLETQIFNLRDANGSMRGIYTIMDGAEAEADVANRKLLDDVQAAPVTDDALEKMRRENRRQELEEYLAQLTTSKNDTTGDAVRPHLAVDPHHRHQGQCRPPEREGAQAAHRRHQRRRRPAVGGDDLGISCRAGRGIGDGRGRAAQDAPEHQCHRPAAGHPERHRAEGRADRARAGGGRTRGMGSGRQDCHRHHAQHGRRDARRRRGPQEQDRRPGRRHPKAHRRQGGGAAGRAGSRRGRSRGEAAVAVTRTP